MNVVCLLLGGPTYTLDGTRFEFTERFGPVVVGASGNILDNQPKPRARFWTLVSLWNEQGRRLTPDGECIFEIPKEPQMVQLAGRHYAEVREGETPEETRKRWLNKLGFGGIAMSFTDWWEREGPALMVRLRDSGCDTADAETIAREVWQSAGAPRSTELRDLLVRCEEMISIGRTEHHESERFALLCSLRAEIAINYPPVACSPDKLK